jgi:hypothetical protein
MEREFNSFRWRWLRVQWYLRLYNKRLRHLDIRSPVAEGIIRQLTHWWNGFSEAQRQFILAREEW